ncbi:DUF6325 family protein [Nocardioides sp.]|uniref:DUF6325 family protein n=1 Tax=Nocardioides sp. TaxID=35761 RepID=UPI003D107959
MPLDLSADDIGPVDVAVILFEGNEFNGEVAPALLDLQESGTVRILDLAFVLKDDAGAASYLEVTDADVAHAFDRLSEGHYDLLNDSELDEVAEGLEPGTSALVVVWENSWAARLGAAIRGSNGRVVALERIPREDVLAAVAALDEEE